MKYIPLYLLFTIGLFAFPAQAQDSASFKLPPYQKLVLKNGLTIYLMEQHEVPMVYVSAVLPAGAIYDKAQSGLASLTASMLMNGTRRMPKKQLEEELDFRGAEVITYATKETAGLSASFAAKDGETVLALVRDVLLAPAFSAQEFEKEKQLLLAQLEQEKESPRNVIDDYFDEVLYGNHVYANRTGGRATSVAKITVADVQRFYKTYYRPDGAAIAIAGDFNAADMQKKIADLFTPWIKGAAATAAILTTPAQPAATRVLLVNKDDARETTFMIGGSGVPRNHPDYVAMEVVNTVFGGRFTSWLNDELRVNTGLTYGAGSWFTRLKKGGTFQISTFTASENTEAAIDKALEVLNKLHTTGIDTQTLTSAKNYVKGGFPPRYETARQLAALLTQMFWYGFDESFINNFQSAVDHLTVEKAKEVVATYFPKTNLQFVLVGKSSDIKKVAAKYGPVTEVQLKKDQTKIF
jgi:predicted Zn-dependent peptidase